MFRHISRRPGRRSTRHAGLWLGVFPTALFLTTLGATAQDPPRWTLCEALDNAFAHSPALRARRAELREAESGLLGARTLPHNPELSLEAADRSSPDGSATDYGFSLTQEIEIAGQRGRRLAHASEEIAAAEGVWLREQRLLAFQVESAFAEAIRARELHALAQTDAELAREVLEFSRRRLERGAATQIEVNLAQASAGRAERGVQRAQAAYTSARSRLAELAGAAPATLPVPLGDLAFPESELPSLAQLVEQALENRGDLRSAERREQAAEMAIRLALAERQPNLVLGGFFQREESSDDIVGATLSVSLPLFNRQQGRIERARAKRERLRHEQSARRLAVEQEVVSALADLRAARAAAEHLRDQVLTTLEDNVGLLQRSFVAGRIGATEVVTLRREFVASRREYIEALTEAWLARIELDLVLGHLMPSRTSTVKQRS